MWSDRSKGNENTYNFKDLKIFDTLEPKKVETFDNNNVRTGLLVDISDSDKPDAKLLGSFLDVKKKEFDLVDLFENLYVTPQHVNKSDLEPDLFDVDNNGTVKSTDKNTVQTLNEIKPTVSKNCDALKDIKARTFDEILDSAISLRYSKLDNEHVQTEGNDGMERKMYEFERFDDKYDNKLKVLSPIFNLNTERYDNDIKTLTEDIEAISNKAYVLNDVNTSLSKEISVNVNLNMNDTANKTSRILNSNAKPFEVKTNANSVNQSKKTMEDSKYDYNVFNVPTVSSQIIRKNEEIKHNIFQPDSVTRYRKDISASLVDQNKTPLCNTQNNPIPLLQTVKKDVKAFNKRRIVKKDSEKIGYTKGPDIYEKSVVLPQILLRLDVRKKALDARANLKRVLVLDSSAINDDLVVPKFAPEVLMEDCNKERIKAMKLRTAFEKFVTSR